MVFFKPISASSAFSAVFSELHPVAEAGADLDVDRGVADRFVVTLEVKHHAVVADTEDVLDSEAAIL